MRRTIWLEDDESVCILDQTALPLREECVRLKTLAEIARAIEVMQVRGAPLIGVTAAYGVAVGLREAASPTAANLNTIRRTLVATRPTAVNLRWAVDRVIRRVAEHPTSSWVDIAFKEAHAIAEEDVAASRSIGEHGADLLETLYRNKEARTLRILTHCNAGFLATVTWGTALAPLYVLKERGIPLHVWVDETRPRNQGYLTAWELSQEGISNTVIVDNAGGHFMQRGEVDAVIVGSDRTTRRGDVCNKIGTLLKALAARAYGIPFYVALPSSTFDLSIESGSEIEIEERDPSEVHSLGFSTARNPAFDVTEAHLVTALITERGVFAANEETLVAAFGSTSPSP
jgi:methylthioribose-1-phosphate isomerase